MSVTQPNLSPSLPWAMMDLTWLETGATICGDLIAFPAGRYHQTETNLRRDNRIQLLVASKKVQGSRSSGQGCLITGTGEILTSGDVVDAVKAKFPWARGALVVHVENFKPHL
jgi:hypothetical protein